MPKRSKTKGANFERKVCQILSLWASDYKREDVFWRSAMSGGRASLKSRKKRGKEFVAQAGDISAIHPIGAPLLELFIIEAKCWADLQLHRWFWLYYGSDATYELWGKTYEMADDTDRQPCVIAKQDRKDELLWTSEVGADYLLCGVDDGKELERVATFPRIDCHIFLLKEVLMAVSYERMVNEVLGDG